MTEQELKDAITSACEADYKHAMAAPKHRFSRTFRKKIKVLLQWKTARHCGCGSAGIASWNNRNRQKFFPESARKIYSDRLYRPCATESGRTGESGNGGNRGQREERNGDWC